MQQYSLPVLKNPHRSQKENIRNTLDMSSSIKIPKIVSEESSFAEYVLKKQQELELAMQIPMQSQILKFALDRQLPKLKEQQKTSPYLIHALLKNRFPTEAFDYKKKPEEKCKSIDVTGQQRLKLNFTKFQINSLVRQQYKRKRLSPSHKLFTSVQ